MARKCVEILKEVDRLDYWLDEDDKCMQHAQAQNDDIKTALCIERGLDASSALLGIIGPGTFTSPWIPYEIGGARGRQRYAQPFKETPPLDQPHPLIAHLIHEVDISKVPAFVSLGIPLTTSEEVEKWAHSVADILQKKHQGVPLYEAKSIQDNHGIQDIYEKNSRLLKPTPLY
ncbi:hypothetical protein F4225_16230 [Candidatus Poribacteria bacterium]|nr:hypothetical protein [Candidatus Poribacteria bacterium]